MRPSKPVNPPYTYQCTRCGHVEPGPAFLATCPRCDGVLLIDTTVEGRREALRALFFPGRAARAGREAEAPARAAVPEGAAAPAEADGPAGSDATRSMWRYGALLPVSPPPPGRDLGEGGTPLLPAVSEDLTAGSPGRVYLKLETFNPTGAFKDRQVSVGLRKALELGTNTIAVLSSGNVAASAAAFAARNGLRCLVFVPETAPRDKLFQAVAHGALVCRVATTSSSELMDLVARACREAGWFHLSTAGSLNPFTVEGAKTIAYELFEQSTQRPAPLSVPRLSADDGPAGPSLEKPTFDWVLVPVGGGGLLGGLWRGYVDISRIFGVPVRSVLPRLVAVQAEGCAPLVRAFREGWDADRALRTAWENPRTIAGGLADDIPFDAHRALEGLRDSGGTAVAVSDEEILDAMRLLATREGVLAEPSAAASVAGLVRLRRAGMIRPSDRVCCLVTGSGLKDTAAATTRVAAKVLDLEPRLGALLSLIKKA